MCQTRSTVQESLLQNAPSPSGEIETVEGFITDITDRRELAEQVARHETRCRAVVEQALAGIYVCPRRTR